MCLQEVRATEKQFHAAIAPALEAGWHCVGAESSAKGRAGVAILSRVPADAVCVGFDVDEFASAGRYIEADFGDVTVGSLYLPTGEAQTPKQDEKEHFMKSFATYLAERYAAVTAAGRDMVVCGDWNIAPTERDIKNWKATSRSPASCPRSARGSATSSRPAGATWYATSTATSLAPIRGGRTAARHSTPMQAGASTTTS